MSYKYQNFQGNRIGINIIQHDLWILKPEQLDRRSHPDYFISMRNMLIKIFDGVKDPRKINRCNYEFGDVLSVALLTNLTKREEYANMALFARHQARHFGLFPTRTRARPATLSRDCSLYLRRSLWSRQFWNRYMICLTKPLLVLIILTG